MSARNCRSDRAAASAIPYHFPLDGDYRIKVVLKRQLYLYLIGIGEPHQIDVRLDGTLLKRFTIGGEGKGMTAPESFAATRRANRSGKSTCTRPTPAWKSVSRSRRARSRRRLVRAPALGTRRRAAAAAARIRAHHERAVLR